MSLETDNPGDQLCQFPDGEVGPAADIHELRLLVVLHEIDSGGSQVIDVKKFTAGLTAAPDYGLWRSGDLGFVKLADQRRDDMGRLQIEVVARTVKIGRHQADGTKPILFSIGLRHSDAGDFCQSVRVVGGLQRSCEQVFFFYRLRSEFRINTGGSQKLELLHTVSPRDR